MRLLYDIGIYLYRTTVFLAALSGNEKAKKWQEGRKRWLKKIEKAVDPQKKKIWFHCASLGEFEQGRPLIEKIKKSHPAYEIVVTFFSPSGYEIRKDYPLADHVFYLPIDTASNAKKFVGLIDPVMAVFVKYEFWYHYMHQLYKKKIPLYVVAATFRENHRFFKWYGGWFKKMLSFPEHIFVQNEESLELLKKINVTHASISGDTRFDRVFDTAQHIQQLGMIEKFCGNSKVIIAGSTWKEDEQALIPVLNKIQNKIKFIIAPHEIHKNHIAELKEKINKKTIIYSQANVQDMEEAAVLIIDNVGLLSRIYQYGTIAYVGGAFRTGLHNILEPAAFGMPVIFGPRYQHNPEAVALIAEKGAYSINSTTSLTGVLQKLISDSQVYQESSNASMGFVLNQKGATGRIFDQILPVLNKELPSSK